MEPLVVDVVLKHVQRLKGLELEINLFKAHVHMQIMSRM